MNRWGGFGGEIIFGVGMKRMLQEKIHIYNAITIGFILTVAAWLSASHVFGAKWLGNEMLLVAVSLIFTLAFASLRNNVDLRWKVSFAALAFFTAVICFASKWPGIRNSLAPALLSCGFMISTGIRSRRLFWLSFPWVFGLLVVLVLPIAIAILRPNGLTAETVFLIRQTSPGEAIGWLIFSGFWIYVVLLFACLTIATVWVRSLPVKIYEWHGLFGLFLFFSGLLSIYPGSHLQTFLSLSQEYDKNIENWRVEAATRVGRILPNDISLNNKCCSKHIVIIGESLSRRYMSAYGYGYPTTPNLDRILGEDAIAFSDVISPHVTTHLSLQYVLTLAQTRFGPLPYQSPTLVEALQGAGYSISWLSNQNRMGKYDATTTVIADQANEKIFLSDSLGDLLKSKPDEILIPHLESALGKPGNQIIFLHLMGQHAPYSERYPSKFLSGESLGKLTEREADYVKAVQYGDAVYGNILDVAKKADVTSVVYFSDHGELVGRGHDSTLFSGSHGPELQMVEVPLVIWINRSQDKYLLQRLNAGRGKPFMLDNLPHLLFDLYGVHGRLVDLTLSPISSTYIAQPRYTLGGSTLYNGSNSIH